ncbi:tafazzin-like [Gigantopelta aegis]|uniref:tafazzin-like n=1 Tax=Gigantopelta aegis TaxID=1735272 RepID=UPI001B889344|nr:tafazzin-like [Gigantopelta aegis]
MVTDSFWLFPSTKRTPFVWKVSSRCVLAVVGLSSKLWLEWVSKFKVYNKGLLLKALHERPSGTGLVTVSNHNSCIDDPLMWGCLRPQILCGNERIRWTLAAEDICFRKFWHALFFSLGQTVPVIRGEGVYQKSMDFMLEKLNKGQWVHMFPEGKVNLSQEFMRLKWGVGRLISECKIPPMVIPMHHIGMDDVLPNEPPYIPQMRKKVTLLIGKPMDFSKELEKLKALKKTPREIRKRITDLIQEEFAQLKERTEALHNDDDR